MFLLQGNVVFCTKMGTEFREITFLNNQQVLNSMRLCKIPLRILIIPWKCLCYKYSEHFIQRPKRFSATTQTELQ